MIIYPAIDLIGGGAVRLSQGRFDDVTAYSAAPADALKMFADAGAQWAHIVDLEGARAGRPVQHELIAKLAQKTVLRLQVGGGYRERAQLARMFDAGIARIVIGSLAVKQPETVLDWMDEFGGDRIVLSLDVRIEQGTPMLAVGGWTQQSGKVLWDIATVFSHARHFVVTDIGRDGMLQGPNVQLYEEIARRLPNIAVQASGGVSSLADLERLPTDGAIIGKALWEGHILLEEACRFAGA